MAARRRQGGDQRGSRHMLSSGCAAMNMARPAPANLITGVPAAIAVARTVRRTIKQNLFWTAIYNVLAIPIAAGILYHVWM